MFVRYQHFKMESLKHVIHLMKPGCLMASLDIRDAYYCTTTQTTSKSTCLHAEKSVSTLRRPLIFWGVLLISKLMIVCLTTTKAQKLKKACQKLLCQSHPTMKAVSKVIGILVASFPGVEMGPL